MSSGQAPLSKTLQARVGALGATADATEAVGQAPFAGTITSVTYIPDATITGANTNTRTIALVNETQSLTVATLALASGTNIAAEAAGNVPVSGTAANVTVAQGDVLAFTSTHAASGLADPGGLVEVTISRA